LWALQPNPSAGGPPLVGCPQLLIQYTCIYPHLENISNGDLRTGDGVGTRVPQTLQTFSCTNRTALPANVILISAFHSVWISSSSNFPQPPVSSPLLRLNRPLNTINYMTFASGDRRRLPLKKNGFYVLIFIFSDGTRDDKTFYTHWHKVLLKFNSDLNFFVQ